MCSFILQSLLLLSTILGNGDRAVDKTGGQVESPILKMHLVGETNELNVKYIVYNIVHV